MSAFVERPDQRPTASLTATASAGIGASRRTRLITIVSVLIGLAGAGWIWQHRHDRMWRHGLHRGQLPGQISRSRGEAAMRLYTNSYWTTGNPPAMPQRVSRYVANLATQVGDYTVSVRQVIRPAYQRSLYETVMPNSLRGPIGPITLSLQVMSARAGAMKRLKDFAADLKGVDSTGQTVTTKEAEQVVSFSKGVARLVRLTEPDAKADYLRRIEGALVVEKPDGSGETTTLPFQIANVPLPVMNMIFGVASATFLTSERLAKADLAAAKTDAPVLLTGGQVESLRAAFPPYTTEPNPLNVPDRLILQPGLPGEFSLTLPKEADVRRIRCRLQLTPGVGGEFATRIAVGKEGDPLRDLPDPLRLWDNEPVILLLPAARFRAGSSSDEKLALLLHLHTIVNPDEMQMELNHVSPFFAKKGERGGELTGSVGVGVEGLRNGRVTLDITRLDEQGRSRSETKQTTLSLSKKGAWRLTNASPGRYRVRIVGAEAYRTAAIPPFTWEEYLKARYGITAPNWTEAKQEVTVRGGSTVQLKPWRVR